MRTKTYSIILLMVFAGSISSHAQKYSSLQANRFALDIYKQFAAQDNQNIFFSPYSLSTAMGMTYAGAKGETKEQIAQAFHFPIDDSDLHEKLGSMKSQLERLSSEGVEVSIANQLWADEEYRFKWLYLWKVKRAYSAPIERMAFRSKPNDSRLEINSWVEEKTNNRIVDLLPKGSISDMTAMVLTNAIFFKGQWEEKFDEKKTAQAEFKAIKGSAVECKMMKRKGKYNLYKGNDIKLLELPYDGKDFSMLVLLPNEGTPLSKIEKGMKLEDLNHYISLMKQTEVQVSLPKFKFDAEYQMKPILAEMGMTNPFSNYADFTRMSGKSDLKIDEIYHKAFVEVSEEGTEAAAATAVVIVRKSATVPEEFVANRPFMFIIRDNNSGNMLFVGRVTNPNS
ncbi:MAG: serpin family protein [Bacteroidales bacterium]